MADPAAIASVLAALTAQAGQQSQTGAPTPLPSALPAPSASGSLGALPIASSSGSIDLGSIKPISSGAVSLADAIAKAKAFAADKVPPRSDSRDRDYDRYSSRDDYDRRAPPPRYDDDRYRRDDRRDPRDHRDRDHRDPRDYRDREPRDFRDPYGRDREDFDHKPHGRGRSRSVSPPRRGSPPRGDVITDTMAVEHQYVGLIIGKGGESLRRIESDTGAKVQFSNDTTVDPSRRTATITGSRGQCAAAKAAMQAIIDDNIAAKGGFGGRGGSGNGPVVSAQNVRPSNSHDDSQQPQTIMRVPDKCVGLIIGRGGESIRNIQERSGIRISIAQEGSEGLRPVTLIGDEQGQEIARNLINEIVDADTSKATVGAPAARSTPSGSVKIILQVPSDAVGMIIGRGGETVKELQAVTGCKVNISGQARDPEREVTLFGSQEAVDRAKASIDEKIEGARMKRESGGYDRPRNDYGRDNYQSSGGGYGGHGNGNYGQPTGGFSPATQQAASAAPAPGGADPYAAYGGYENYVQLWAQYQQSLQTQQQQNGSVPPQQ